MPNFGVLAATTDYGIASERLALVPAPGPDWPTLVAAGADGQVPFGWLVGATT
ncbi:hypothetical protein [Krasilnikovia cinnamomea]|uniref:hypothetical protein n=1 Tax=Krasilnikovia cinnamomea TaxID=349313 RepID=UPI0013EEEEDE|nr:hypothetical protein [Krasilnikovia cinnamomea]